MTTLHMETKQTRGIAQQIIQAMESLSTEVNSISLAAYSMDWLGPSRESFVALAKSLEGSFNIQLDQGRILAQRINIEISEWEQIVNTHVDQYGQKIVSIGAITAGLSVSNIIKAGANNVPVSAWAYVTEVPPRTYAILSELAYSDSATLPQDLKDQGWEVLSTATEEGLTGDGYAGTAFINPNTGEVVIAHRGTDTWTLDKNLSSDLDDDLAIAQGKLPAQYHVSREFVDSVKDKLSQDPRFNNYTLVHTGHSLGAALSDLNAMQDGSKGIGFDNPGTYQIIKNNTSEFLGARENQKNIISYQSNPNLVHLGGQNLGHVVDIVPADGSTKPPNTLVGAFFQTSKHHNIQNIINSMSPETGFPKGYFPPSAGEINHGFHNLDQVNQGKVNGVIQAPMCFPPKELPYLPEYIDTPANNTHQNKA